MALRGIRGAITVEVNSKEDIIEKTCELLEVMIKENCIRTEDVASAIFSLTPDLNAEFPAVAARKLGWIYTPLICMQEIPVPGSLPNCIRVLLHVNSEKSQQEMTHVYLNGASVLRPDIESGTTGCGNYIS